VLRAVAVVVASAPAISFALIWGSKFLSRTHGVPQASVATYLWLPPLAFDVGSVLFGDLASRRQRSRAAAGLDPRAPHRLLLGVAAVLGTALALVPLASGPWAATGVVAVSMLGGGGVYAIATADMLQRVGPGEISAASGLTAAAQSITYVVLHPLIGGHVDATGSFTLVAIALGAWVAPGSIVWILHTTRDVGEGRGSHGDGGDAGSSGARG
jgi:hypothetical protein